MGLLTFELFTRRDVYSNNPSYFKFSFFSRIFSFFTRFPLSRYFFIPCKEKMDMLGKKTYGGDRGV